MISQEPQEKKFRQLSDEELEKVTGGCLDVMPMISCSIKKCRDLGKKMDSETCECI